MKKYYVLFVAVTLYLAAFTNVYGMGMGTGMTGSTTNDMTANGMMGSSDTYGMMNGMTGSPVVGSDGTAYLVTYQASGSASSTFTSTLTAVTSSGQKTSITLTGIVSRPALSSDGSLLVAATSMPDVSQYSMMASYNSSSTSKSTLYAVQLPFTQSSKPIAVSLDGNFASAPVIANNKIYVSTTDFGGSMMGIGSVSNPQQGNSYLYIINFNGTVASKTQL